ncbi:MAG: 4Fe-4S binding protein [Bacteroidales bacterium]
MHSALKAVRVVVSLLVLGLFIFIYLDNWTGISVRISKYLLDFQFIPSFLKAFVSHSLIFGGFIIIFFLTMLFGRIYCSFLCPLGVIQDILTRLKSLFSRGKSNRHKKLPALNILRYSLLGLVMLTTLAGSMSLLIWLDPYSISGRMISHLLRPVVNFGFNLSVEGLNRMNYYDILPVDWNFRSHFAFWAILYWFLIVLVLSVRYGRLYCNSLCPLGTFLGFFSQFSLFRIKINGSSCDYCGKCVRECKAGCINIYTSEVDFSRCVGCQNCITSCDNLAINYQNILIRSKSNDLSADKDRRNWIAKAFSVFVFIPVSSVKKSLAQQEVLWKKEDLPQRIAVTAPGSLGRDHFTEHCTACHLCVNHCPTQVLQPSGLEISIGSMFQPVMDFSVKYCLYECNVCTLVCPTGAILPLSMEEKKRVQPGRSRFIEHLCVVVTKGTLCGACSEHCPTKACDMVPYKDNLTIPEVDVSICVGCGACEHVCPTYPKSIVVDENPIHLTALPPRKKALEPLINKGKEVIEEFPF